MKFNYINNHIVIPIDTKNGIKNVVLDTGNPTFTVLNDETINEISFCGVDFKLGPNFMVNPFRQMINWEQISDIVQTEIHGFIGFDFLSNYNLIIDLKNNEIIISDDNDGFYLSKIDFFMNIPIIRMKIQDIEINAIFDTGAMYSIVNTNYINFLINKNKTINDYNPMLGKFTADLFEGNIKIKDFVIENAVIACSPKYDIAMQMVQGKNINGFLGISTLNDKIIFLSYKNKQLGLKKHNIC